MLPYFRPPDVAGLHRCYFEFRSQEVNQWVDRYRGYKRYRFNKYVPISDRFPEPTVDGLVFKVSNSTTERLIGMQTAWELPAGGEVSFTFSDSHLLSSELGGFAEVGLGFRQYDTPWWWEVDALLFSCRRQLGTTQQAYYTTLHGTLIPGSNHLAGIGSAFKMTAKNTGPTLELHFIEYGSDGITPVATSSRIFTNPDLTKSYPIMMYCRSFNASAEFLLARTDIHMWGHLPPFILEVHNFPYNGTDGTDGTPYDLDLTPGTYQMEAWGAGETGKSGGAYTSGLLQVTHPFPVYVYVGGTPTGVLGGWNGGGKSGTLAGVSGFGGCGASDIRLLKGVSGWNDFDSLVSRIMVAGGAGREAAGGGGGSIDGQPANLPGVDEKHYGEEGKRDRGGVGGLPETGTPVPIPVTITNQDLYDNSHRFSHGGVNQPSNPAELAGWSYDPVLDVLMSAINSTTHIGLVPNIYSDAYDFSFKATSSAADNDRMCMVLAFSVADPSTGIAGREYTLTAVRNQDAAGFTWQLVFNYNMSDQWIIAEGTPLVPRVFPDNWNNYYPDGTLFSATRRGPIITVTTSQTGSNVLDPATTLSVDIRSDPRLRVFDEPCAIGFSCLSQQSTEFKDISLNLYNMTYPNSGTDGGFGFGGDGGHGRDAGWGNGGAGGWYGAGGGGGPDNGTMVTGGGSSFISGHHGCSAVDAAGVPLGHAYHPSSNVFKSTSIKANERVEDHGFVRITKMHIPPAIMISPVETIYFYENPSEYTLPLGPLQAPALDIYSQPHVAYIEDGTIQLSAPAAPQGWVNLLYFLLDSTVEPMIFSDITGAKWLTCFQEVTGKGRKVQGKTASGYELRLPVLVVH